MCGTTGAACQIHIPKRRYSFSAFDCEPRTPSKFIKQQSHDFFNDYTLELNEIGKGLYGVIKKCVHKRTRLKYAVKEIAKSGLPLSVVENRGIYKQIQVLKEIDHPCVLRIHEFYEDSYRYFIVMDYYSGGDLFDKMIELGKLAEVDCANIIWQILSTLSYLHSKHIIHRDLKPENILLEDSESEISVKIIDFDNVIQSEEPVKGVVGTLEYMAPEVFDSSYDEKCDIWSLGVLLYVLISGNSPFGADTDDLVRLNIKQAKYEMTSRAWRDVSSAAKDFIGKVLVKNPKKRVSAEEALKHPWVHSANPYKAEALTSLLRLKQFTNKNKVKEVLYTYILSHIIPYEELKTLKLAFQQLDYNAHGKISKNEVVHVLESSLEADDAAETAEVIFFNGDSDKNGYLEYSEFLRAAIEQKDLLCDANIEKAFLMIDSEGNGQASYEEFKESIGSDISESTVTDMMAMLDPTSTGVITLEQFKGFLLTD